MVCLSRTSLLFVLALVPSLVTLSGCGKAPELKRPESAEQNSREEPSGSAAPTDEAASSGEELAGDKDVATSDGEDGRSRGVTAPAKKSKPSPPPTVTPPPPPAAEAPKPDPQERMAEAEPPSPPAAAPGGASSDKDGLGAGGTGKGGGGTGAGAIGTSAGSPAPAASAPVAAAAAPENKTFDVMPVYFGTDRGVEADPKRLQFGSERGHKLKLGRALVTVPLAHKVPHIERPYVLEIPYFKIKVYEEKEDVNKHFTLQEIKGLSKEELLALVKERLSKSANFKDHAIVFVHGFNTSFDAALYRTAQIAYDLKFDGAPFVYSWPSGGKVASYTYDNGSAEQSEPYLAEFLDMVVKETGAKSISLIAHSMGNQLLLRVLERMRPKTPEGVVISQVILAAPDVDRDKFNNIAREITSFAKGVTLYAASNDRALGYSARFWGGVPRAGDVPKDGPLIVPGVDTIDVTSVSTDSLGLNHSGYAENPALLNDVKLLIQTGERPPDKRIPILKKMTTAAGGSYWRYP